MTPLYIRVCGAGYAAVAGTAGRHQAAEVREDLREENVHAHRRPVQRRALRVRDLS